MRGFIRVSVSQGSVSRGSFSPGSAARLGRWIVGIGVLLCAFVRTSPSAAGGAARRHADQSPGQELFTREWRPGDRLSDAGDALGPMYNEVSCAKCHRLGAIGGAGPNENNVDLLTIVRPNRELTTVQKKKFQARVDALHSGFQAQAGAAAAVVLHRFGTDDAYAAFRAKLLREKEHLLARAVSRENVGTASRSDEVLKHHYVSLRHTQRNTTSLFGAGLIDTIPAAALEQAAAEQAQRQQAQQGTSAAELIEANVSPVSGRVPPSNQGGPGRFGWRGQTATLRDFVLTACAMEVGLEVPGHHQAADPLDPERTPRGFDLNEEQCNQLVAFVAKLPAPSRLELGDSQAASAVQAGETTFEAVGCADCHRRQMGPVTGIYSDLLLHDMGPGLADPVPANSEQRVSGGGGYFGGAVPVFAVVNIGNEQELQQEWRTPPLWGVRDSAPYLHDGRAATLDDAIRQHGGEARTSLRKYNELPQQQRMHVIAFLKSI